jgi:hypothetical protein
MINQIIYEGPVSLASYSIGGKLTDKFISSEIGGNGGALFCAIHAISSSVSTPVSEKKDLRAYCSNILFSTFITLSLFNINGNKMSLGEALVLQTISLSINEVASRTIKLLASQIMNSRKS